MNDADYYCLRTNIMKFHCSVSPLWQQWRSGMASKPYPRHPGFDSHDGGLPIFLNHLIKIMQNFTIFLILFLFENWLKIKFAKSAKFGKIRENPGKFGRIRESRNFCIYAIFCQSERANVTRICLSLNLCSFLYFRSLYFLQLIVISTICC